MSRVSLIMFLLGSAGIMGSLVWMLVVTVRKRSTKKVLKIFGGFILLTILSIILNPNK